MGGKKLKKRFDEKSISSANTKGTTASTKGNNKRDDFRGELNLAKVMQNRIKGDLQWDDVRETPLSENFLGEKKLWLELEGIGEHVLEVQNITKIQGETKSTEDKRVSEPGILITQQKNEPDFWENADGHFEEDLKLILAENEDEVIEEETDEELAMLQREVVLSDEEDPFVPLEDVSCQPVKLLDSLKSTTRQRQESLAAALAMADENAKAKKRQWESESDTASVASVTEELCRLRDEKRGHETLRDQYLSAQELPLGLSNKNRNAVDVKCVDKNRKKNERCLPPELVLRAINTETMWGIPENTPLTRSQFKSLIRHVEQHPTNDYICLVYARPYLHPEFNPYTFKVVHFSDLDPKNYYTLSRNGIVCFRKEFAEFFSLVEFESQMLLYDRVKQLQFFKNFREWRVVTFWQRYLRNEKVKRMKEDLQQSMFICRAPLRNMLLKLHSATHELSASGFLHLESSETLSLARFLEVQKAYLVNVEKSLKDFKSGIVSLAVDACRSCMTQEGFSIETYAQEMRFYLKNQTGPANDEGKMVNVLLYPGQWLTYSKQMQKRSVCFRITEFLKLVDYYMNTTYFKLMKNTMIILMNEMARLSANLSSSSEFQCFPTHLEQYKALMESHEKYGNKLITPATNSQPLVDIGCSWNETELIFAPSAKSYIRGFHKLFGWWRKIVVTLDNVINHEIFMPYTEPIINGMLKKRKCGTGPDIQLFLGQDPEILQIRNTTELILQHGFECSREYAFQFDRIRIFCIHNDDTNINDFRKIRAIEIFNQLLLTYEDQINMIKGVEKFKVLGVLRMNNHFLKRRAAKSIMRCVSRLHRLIPKVGSKLVTDLQSNIEFCTEQLAFEPESPEDFVAYIKFLDDMPKKMGIIESDLSVCTKLFDLIRTHEMKGTEAVNYRFEGLKPILSDLTKQLAIQLTNREHLISALVNQMNEITQTIFMDVELISATIQGPEILDAKSDSIEMHTLMLEKQIILQTHYNQAMMFNEYQRQLKLDVMDFAALSSLMELTRLRFEVWDGMVNWDKQRKEWDEVAFISLDPEQMQREVNKYLKNIELLEQGLPPNDVVKILKDKVDELNAQLPLIGDLRNPDLKPRHWAVLERTIQQSVRHDKGVTLKSLSDAGISELAQLIQQVSQQASAESKIEALVFEVENTWKDIELPISFYKDSFTLGSTAEMQSLLDFSNAHINTITSSPEHHFQFIKIKLDEWIRLLTLFANTLDVWLTCQKNWIYLESIFSSADIQRKLPSEAKMFNQADKVWKEIMAQTNRMPLALRAATYPGLFESLSTANQLLEQVSKSLDDYLESKRLLFPRFYLLSNEELLKVLAQTNPREIQPYLSKCFDSVTALEYQNSSSDCTIQSILSSQSRLSLLKNVKVGGGVEQWMKKVEDTMFSTLRKAMRDAYHDYHKMAYDVWLDSSLPSQCILSISQVIWTQKVEEILLSIQDSGESKYVQGKVELEKFAIKSNELANHLVCKIREPVSHQRRMLLRTLIISHTHSIDIVNSLIKAGVNNTSEFDWQKQFRFYWQSHGETVVARMGVNNYGQCNYGYEFSEPSFKPFVITPLTDRCYFSIMGALRMHIGSALIGHFGSGKTETIKQLSKRLAVNCVIFNCNPSTDSLAMGKLFSGFVQCGFWCCLDDFNRMDLKVSSVISQQLMDIRMAQTSRLAKFIFEGREIKISQNFAAFLTFNPFNVRHGTEMIQNLNGSFRRVSLMVPDECIVVQTLLCASGFQSFKTLGVQLIQVYKLCKEHLPQQKHYDFGLQSITSVVMEAAEKLKIVSQIQNEGDSIVQALLQENLPKLLPEDVDLFKGFIRDAFSFSNYNVEVDIDFDVHVPSNFNGEFLAQVKVSALSRGLQAPESFVEKVCQLHGIMKSHIGSIVVGLIGSGKTTVISVLKDALNALSLLNKYEESENEPQGACHKVKEFVINPNCFSQSQLFGHRNEMTDEWENGFLNNLLSFDQTNDANNDFEEKWLILDACLLEECWTDVLSNQHNMQILFEVTHLHVASPATVSRCGIVYISDTDMPIWKCYFQSWLMASFKDNLSLQNSILILFDSIVNPSLEFIDTKCSQLLPQQTIGKVASLCSLLSQIMAYATENTKLENSNEKPCSFVKQMFIFAFLWGFGGNLDENSRGLFNAFLLTLDIVKNDDDFQNYNKMKKTSQTSTLWDVYFDYKSLKFVKWNDLILTDGITNMKAYPVYPQGHFVPTVQTVQCYFLCNLLLNANRPTLLFGPFGAGKTMIAKTSISSICQDQNFSGSFLSFAYGTTSQEAQEMIENQVNLTKSDAEVRKCIVFIDDLNMPYCIPQCEIQPPIDFLRHLIDFRAFFDPIKLQWRALDHVTFCGACVPRMHATMESQERCFRHFCMLSVSHPDSDTLHNIFATQLKESQCNQAEEIYEEISTLIIKTYEFMKNTFLPTPSNFHYVFNMRDMARCFHDLLEPQGIYRNCLPSVINKFILHECQRVFCDRLDTVDESLFHTHHRKSWIQTVTTENEVDKLIFNNFSKQHSLVDDKGINEMSVEKLKQILSEYLEDYNAIHSSNKTSLVLFTEAAKHVARICRILRQSSGHVFLLGLHGRGKKSLAKLASFIVGYKLFQLGFTQCWKNRKEVYSFRKDLVELLYASGFKDEEVVFLVSLAQMKDEFLNDISNVLNESSDLHLTKIIKEEKLFKRFWKDKTKSVYSEAKTNTNMHFESIVQRIRSKLHFVFCASPEEDKDLRIQCRKFPRLISHCTINWIDDWSNETLLSVAKVLVSSIDFGRTMNISVETLAKTCVHFHNTAMEVTEMFSRESKWKCCITPSLMVQFTSLCSLLIEERQLSIVGGKERIQSGIKKLEEINELLKQMKSELKDLEPAVMAKGRLVEQLTANLWEEQGKGDVVRRNVAMEEATAKDKAWETQGIAEDAQRDLAEALPALEAAVKSLDALEKADITEVRQFQKPPELVRTVMESVCVLLGCKADWNYAKDLLSDAGFLRRLYDFDKDNISEATLKKLKMYVENPNFTPEKVGKVSKACRCICLWVKAIDLYAKVFKTVEPKRSRYASAGTELEQLMDTLRTKQTALNQLDKKIASLQEQYENTIQDKEQLEAKIVSTQVRISRATRVSTSLSAASYKWTQSIQTFDDQLKNFIGDVFVAAACVAYFGPFTNHFRKLFTSRMVEYCNSIDLSVTSDFALQSFGNPVQLRIWNAHGLPRDEHSTENAILATKDHRLPFLIDPQGQANRWIKQFEKSCCLKVIKFNDPSLFDCLEESMHLSCPCLIEEAMEIGDEGTVRYPAVVLNSVLRMIEQHESTYSESEQAGTSFENVNNFRLYFTCRLNKPLELVASPGEDFWNKLSIINFGVVRSVSSEGTLEDELLGDVVSLERPELETQRASLIAQMNEDKNQLIGLETKMLQMLIFGKQDRESEMEIENTKKNILDDEILIDAVNESKEMCKEIMKRIVDSEATEKGINLARERFRPVAQTANLLFSLINQLQHLNPIYQYSLNYFKHFFMKCISTTLDETSDELEERLQLLKRETIFATYSNISLGLLPEHKLVFSFLLCVLILRHQKGISLNEWTTFLKCHSINDLHKLAIFKEVKQDTPLNIRIGKWKGVLFHKRDFTPSDDMDRTLTKFQKLILVKAACPEKIIEATAEFVNEELGPKFISSDPIDINFIFEHLTSKVIPCIFMQPKFGSSDPVNVIFELAHRKGCSDRVVVVSMSENQLTRAERAIISGINHGDWVFIRNCHLGSRQWLDKLDLLVQKASKNMDAVHDSFRLFLSTKIDFTFPIFTFRNSLKVMSESPKSVKGKLKQIFHDMDKDFFEDNILGSDWKRLILGLGFFHAVVQDRKRFECASWNVKYDFNTRDLDFCLSYLEKICDDGKMHWNALSFLIGDVIYGGQISDQWDMRCLRSIIKRFVTPALVLQTTFQFSSSGIYLVPPKAKKLNEFQQYIDNLPFWDSVDIFGLQDISQVALQNSESRSFLTALLETQPAFAESEAQATFTSKNQEVVLNKVRQLMAKLPREFPQASTTKWNSSGHDRNRMQTLQIFLMDEIRKMTSLLKTIESSLQDLQNLLLGHAVMCNMDMCEEIYSSVFRNHVPSLWQRQCYSFPCNMNLCNWFHDLLLRANFLKQWEVNGAPNSFWLPGFFEPAKFLGAVLLAFAKSNGYPLAMVKFKYEMTSMFKHEVLQLDAEIEAQIQEKVQKSRNVEEGVFIHGLYLEGAEWDTEKMKLRGCSNKLNSDAMSKNSFPIVHFVPFYSNDEQERTQVNGNGDILTTPLYKVSPKDKDASLSNMSSENHNFITSIDLPIPSSQPKDFWILNGTKLVCMQSNNVVSTVDQP